MGLQWGNYYFGSLSNLPGYETMMAQAHRTAEQQMAYVRSMQQYRPTPSDMLSQLLNYQPPNPIPWERRYAEFCERLDKATSNPRPSE